MQDVNNITFLKGSRIMGFRVVWDFLYIDFLPTFYKWWKFIYLKISNLKDLYLEVEVEWLIQRINIDFYFLNEFFCNSEILNWNFKENVLSFILFNGLFQNPLHHSDISEYSDQTLLKKYFQTTVPLWLIKLHFKVEEFVILDHDMSIANSDDLWNKSINY